MPLLAPIANLPPPLVDASSSTSTLEGNLIVNYYHSTPWTGDSEQNLLDETPPNHRGQTGVLNALLSNYQKLSDDWDGEGGVATTLEAATSARRILEIVGTIAEALRLESTVDPLPNGGLDMEWISQYENQLLLEIQPQGGGINFSLCKKTVDGKRTYSSDRLYDLAQVGYLLLWLDS